jgi:hypothetical protein
MIILFPSGGGRAVSARNSAGSAAFILAAWPQPSFLNNSDFRDLFFQRIAIFSSS